MKLESEVGKVADSVAEVVELLDACMCGENSIHTFIVHTNTHTHNVYHLTPHTDTHAHTHTQYANIQVS